MESSTAKGTKLENQVYDLIKDLLNQDNFIVPNKHSEIFKKKGYYSLKRDKEIIFDVTVETKLPNADKYSMLVVFECKNLGSKVTVDDIEEFGSKLNQVGEHNTKGIIVTTNTFQKSAYTIAKKEGIGLIRLNSSKEIQWINYRKYSSFQGKSSFEEEKIEFIDENHNIEPFVATYNGSRFTNFADLLIKLSVIDCFKDNEEFIELPYVSHERINHIVDKLYSYDLYNGYTLDFDKLTSFLEPKYDVKFELDTSDSDNYLGKIEFNPLCIKISNKARVDNNRWRFTLAHEIGHLILHSKLLKDRLNEKSDNEDTLSLKYSHSKKHTEKLEIQANLFASYLLLPEKLLINVVSSLFKEYRIHKNYLFLDNQRVNQIEVYEILRKISSMFHVSIESIKIRLIKLNLLVDKTDYRIGTLLRDYMK